MCWGFFGRKLISRKFLLFQVKKCQFETHTTNPLYITRSPHCRDYGKARKFWGRHVIYLVPVSNFRLRREWQRPPKSCTRRRAWSTWSRWPPWPRRRCYVHDLKTICFTEESNFWNDFIREAYGLPKTIPYYHHHRHRRRLHQWLPIRQICFTGNEEVRTQFTQIFPWNRFHVIFRLLFQVR